MTGEGDGARSRPWLPLAVQLGAFVLILGIPDGALGVLWPSMRATFHLPLDDLGALTIAGTALYMAGGLLANRVRQRFGLANAMVGSCLIAIVSLAAWAGAPGWLVLLSGVALLGLARGVIDAVLNAEAALEGGIRRLGLLHGSWALGGTLGPILVATVLVAAHNWRVAVVITGLGVVALTPLAVLERGPTVRNPRPAPGGRLTGALGGVGGDGGGDEAVGGRAAPEAGGRATARVAPPRSRLPLILTVTAFAVYTAAESGPIAWGYTYLLADRRLSHTFAALAMALFWAALTAGRFGLAIAHDSVPPTAVLEGSCLLLVAGTAMFWLLPGASAVAGLPVAGLGSAAIFPMLVALTPARIGATGTGRAVGASIAAAGLGGPVAVAVFGVMAAHLGIGVLGVCLFSAAVAMYGVNRVLTTVTRRLAR
jgi:fucose permease